MDVGIENDGTPEAKEFRLDLEFPTEFDDAAVVTHYEKLQTGPVTNCSEWTTPRDGYYHVYPTEKTDVLLEVRLAVRNSLLRSNPELSKRPFIATVYSGDMKPRVTQRTISELIAK